MSACGKGEPDTPACHSFDDLAAPVLDEASTSSALGAVFEEIDHNINFASGGDDIRDAIDWAVDRLSETGEYLSVELSSDQKTIILSERDGITTVLNTMPVLESGRGESSASYNAPRTTHVLQQDRYVPPPETIGVCRPTGEHTVGSGGMRSTGTPGSRRAALLDVDPVDGSSSFGGRDPLGGVRLALQNAGYEIAVDVERDEVTLQVLMEVLGGDYGVIAISTHGGVARDDRTYIQLGQPFDLETYTALPNDLKPFVMRYMDVRGLEPQDCAQLGIGERCRFFAIDSRLVEHYTFRDSFVYIGGCYALYQEDLARAFLGGGAGAFLSYTDAVVTWFEPIIFERFMTEFAQPGVTVRGAHIATVFDRDVFSLRPYAGLFDREYSTVLDLDCRLPDDRALVLYQPDPPVEPSNELEDDYIADLVIPGLIWDPSQRLLVRPQRAGNGEINGTVQLMDNGRLVGQPMEIVAGRIEGRNLYLCFRDGGDLNTTCLSARAPVALAGFLPNAFLTYTFFHASGSWVEADFSHDNSSIFSGEWSW
jgi:hypothetical protein